MNSCSVLEHLITFVPTEFLQLIYIVILIVIVFNILILIVCITVLVFFFLVSCWYHGIITGVLSQVAGIFSAFPRKGRVEWRKESLGRKLESVIETANSVYFLERVLECTEFSRLFVIRRRIVSIECEDLLSQREAFKHLLRGLCQCNACVRLEGS